MRALRKHWPIADRRFTACGRDARDVMTVSGNPEAVDCGRCRVTYDYLGDLHRLSH